MSKAKILQFIQRHLGIILVLAVTALVYGNTLQHDFVWDDYFFIVEWEQTRNLPENFVPFLKGALPEGQEGAYRPLRSIFYALSFIIWGTSPAGYHFQAILIQLAATILVYLISLKLLKNQQAALLSALLFGIHPVHIEAITWITASFDTIGIIFFLGAFYYFLRFREQKDRRDYWLANILAAIAFFTTEITIIFPLLLVLYDACFGYLKRNNLRARVWEYAPFLVSNALFWFIRFNLLSPNLLKPILESPGATALVMVRGLVKYLELFFVPVHQTVNHLLRPDITSFYYHDYNFENLPQRPSLFALDILLSLGVLIGLLVAGILFRRRLPLLLFTFGWFLISLFPVMQFFPHGVIFAERFMYPATVMLSIWSGWLLYRLVLFLSKKTPVHVPYAVIGIIALALSVQTVQRNLDWKDSIQLWKSALETTPNSATLHANLGGAYIVAKDLDRAMKQYEKAVQLNPNSFHNINVLGTIYYHQQEYQKAVAQFEKLVSLNPNLFESHVKLAESYSQQGDILKAVDSFRKALNREPNNAYVLNRLLEIEREQSKTQQ